MLVVSNVSKRFPGAEGYILRDISFVVNAGERVGLIGPNGSGKSTLLRIIMREIDADTGGVQFSPPDVRVGYLSQGSVPEAGTVESVLLPHSAALRQAETEVERLAGLMTSMADAELLADYDSALERLMELSNLAGPGDMRQALVSMGLADLAPKTSVQTLSGGQKTRLALAAISIRQPHLLVLDEPTNHLDLAALEWLEAWLRHFTGGVLVVSHDRAFLDRVIDRIVALNIETHTARVHAGNYTSYMHTLQSERDKQWAQWSDQQAEIERLRHDAQRTMARAVRKENATNNDRQRRYAKKVAKKAKAKEKRLERYLESDERVDKPGQTWQVKMEFGDVGHIRGDAVRLDAVSVGYDASRPLLTGLDLRVGRGEHIAITGPNGHGKTTLLRTVIGQLSPLNGSVQVAASVRIGYLAQEQDILDPLTTPLQTIQREARLTETEARSFLHFFLFAGDDSLRPVGDLSYGERTRLMLARLVARGSNLLVLDEPLNHLDLESRDKFEQALANFAGTVLAVAHDRYFIDRFADTTWIVADGNVEVELCAVEQEAER